ncbi:MAG: extracellular solute-binding protein, partial [Bacteroidota bacterium]
ETYPELDYAVAVLPRGKKAATLAFSTAFVISEAAPFPDDAWQLLSYMAGKEGMKEWTQSGIALPTRRSVAEANQFDKHPIYKTFMESVPFSRLYQVRYMERWSDEMLATMQSFFYKDTPIRPAMEKLQQKITKYKLP